MMRIELLIQGTVSTQEPLIQGTVSTQELLIQGMVSTQELLIQGTVSTQEPLIQGIGRIGTQDLSNMCDECIGSIENDVTDLTIIYKFPNFAVYVLIFTLHASMMIPVMIKYLGYIQMLELGKHEY